MKPQVSTPEAKMPENLSREARCPIRNTLYMILLFEYTHLSRYQIVFD